MQKCSRFVQDVRFGPDDIEFNVRASYVFRRRGPARALKALCATRRLEEL
jgi:hypothetical protein